MALLDRFRKRVDTTAVLEERKPEASPPLIPRYTDGFEAIYALENVDLATVRPMSKPAAPTVEVREVSPRVHTELERERELELDLGPAYRGWMESFRLGEPIEVLGLSPMAYKALISQERLVIRDLFDSATQQVIALSGMGQGHIEEIHERLRVYVGERPLFRCRFVDYVGLLRGLLNGINHKNVHMCLEKYELHALFPLNAAQNVEVRHLSEQHRREAAEQARSEMRSDGRQKRVKAALREVAEVFIKPWIRGRTGLATEAELLERAEAVGDDLSTSRLALRAIRELFCEGAFPFHSSLLEVEPGLYCADYRIKKRAQALAQRLQSYFYRRGLSYSLKDLTEWICREQAMRFDAESPEFVEAFLRMSKVFRVRMGTDGQLWVRRS